MSDAPVTKRPYQVEMESAMLLAQLAENINTEQLLAALQLNDTIGPFFAPRSYGMATERLRHQREIFEALHAFRQAWLKAKPEFLKPVSQAALRLAKAEADVFQEAVASQASRLQ